MPIPFFGPAQTDAFIPALVWFLAATVFATTPVVLGPLLARARAGRAIAVTAFAVAVAAAIPGVLQTAQAFGTLADEHAAVQSTLASRYGLEVTSGEVSSLMEGGKIRDGSTGSRNTIRLEEVSPGQYAPVQWGVGPLPAR